jgi:hypothetical protein
MERNISPDHMAWLAELADYLLDRQSYQKALIVPFVGAGASISAGLPNSGELQRLLYDKLIQQEGQPHLLAQLLDDEARSLFPQEAKHGILRLKLFKFSAVISRFAYGREQIHNVINSVMSQAMRRPLAYELLAHLAKHEYVDHFVSLNFDRLLDEALEDEISDRLRFITSPDEVPGPMSVRSAKPNCCYLFKPFGSLSNDSFKLQPDDLSRYGSESIWRFMLDNVFRRTTGNQLPQTVLILIGYAAAEPAFEQLISELLVDPDRQIRIFFIDSGAKLPESLKRFIKAPNYQVRHIRLKADLAFDLLLRILKIKYRSAGPNRVWIPVARHRVIASLSYRDVTQPARRFRSELILQAIKSRGFFTIEAVAEIGRIRKYAQEASKVIEQMCKDRILSPVITSSGPTDSKYLRQDYRLQADERLLSAKLLETSSHRSTDKIDEWEVSPTETGFAAKSSRIDYSEFLERRFQEIRSAPEIEVSANASPSTPWLFRDAQLLTSISQLTETTAELFDRALCEAEGQLQLCGIWTTGEWIFHEEGWAWKTIGAQLIEWLRNGRLKMSLVRAKNTFRETERLKRGQVVTDRLAEFSGQDCCEIDYLDWWRLNRNLTLLCWHRGAGNNKKAANGIYMRRRLATPLVAPVCVTGYDAGVLREIFLRYQARARKSSTPDAIGSPAKSLGASGE